MKNNIFKNYIYNVSYQILILIVPVITMPYVSRVLQDENIGLFNFFQSIVSYFVLFGCVGLNLYGQREVAFYKDDPHKRSRVFWELFIIRFCTVLLSLAAYLLVIVRGSTGYARYYAIFIIEIVASLFDISWFYQGIENFKLQAVRNFFVKTAGMAAIFIFVKTVDDLDVYIWCYALTNLIGNLLLWVRLPGYLSRTHVALFGITKHIPHVIVMFVPQIATTLYGQLDKTMIRLFSNYKEVGYYGQAEKIVKIVLTLVTSLGLVMLSRIANSFSKGNKEAIRAYIEKSFRFLFVVAYPAMFGVMAISKGMVPWFFGDGFERVGPCMIALSPIILFIGISNIIGTQYLLPTNRVKEYTLSVVCGLVTNVILNSVLISEFGCYGASIATIIAELVVTLVQFYLVRKDFSVSIVLVGWKNLIAGAIMGGVVYLLSLKLSIGIMSTMLEVAVGAIIYIGLLWVFNDRFLFDTLKGFLKRDE